ncbi:MAG: hydantoinase B/oxoprolinase family protein, partial [Alphaproteobacteria bacterium]|nr:hydantoinase B/oxoprolinase family protein [Alphaproteobacteria bacterium]
GGFAVRALLKAFTGRIDEGDVFLLNDPYVAGGNHLPDWVIARPVHAGGRIVAFACNRAHQSDIGGGAAGTYNPAATEIFQEGIRLPPLKLIEAGEVRDDLWQLLMINCRTPELLDGDLRAMIGSTRIGAERIAALMEELGHEAGEACFRGVLDHAERRFREAIAGVPDGRYETVEITDNDCFEETEIAIHVAMTVAGEEMTVDFTGTDPQMRGFKNSSLANTYSAVYMGLASFFEPDLPRNEGTFRSVEIIAPEGSVVNPRPPAPVTMCTVFVAHEIIHAIWKALSEACPERGCAGWGKSVHGVTAGDGGEGAPFVMYHWNSIGGAGAVEGRDGFNQIGHLVALGGLTLPNVETYEQIYPVHFLRQEFRCDGGGAGAFRGGTGIDYEVEIEVPADYSFRGEGVGVPSGYGIAGGDWGKGGTMTLYPQGGEPYAAPKYGVR